MVTKDDKIERLFLYCSGITSCKACRFDGESNCDFSEWDDAKLDEGLRQIEANVEETSEEAEGPSGTYLAGAVADNVNHPQHYELPGGIECIDVLLATQGKRDVQAFCICNAIKYLFRHRRKNGLEDVKKARWYLNKFIELEEK